MKINFNLTNDQINDTIGEIQQHYKDKLLEGLDVSVDYAPGSGTGPMFLFNIFAEGDKDMESHEDSYLFADHDMLTFTHADDLEWRDFVDDCKDRWEDIIPQHLRK